GPEATVLQSRPSIESRDSPSVSPLSTETPQNERAMNPRPETHLRPDRVALHVECAKAAPPPGRRGRLLLGICLLLPFVLSGCASLRRPSRPANPAPIGPFETRGIASWYGNEFNGRRTANGERYDQNGLTAAHRTLPFGSRVAVTNLENGETVVVKINDRGPFAKDRILDLSYGAAREIGVVGPGTARVQLDLLDGPGVPPRYTVQIGAFSDPERANALHDQLQGTYPEVYVRSDGVWNRVQVGAFADRDHAEEVRRELAALGMSAFVIAGQ